MINSAYSSGWYPITSSSSPSINIFIPHSSSSSRETHEMYNELDYILRHGPSKPTSSPTFSCRSRSSLGSSFTKSRSSVMKWIGTVRPELIGLCMTCQSRSWGSSFLPARDGLINPSLRATQAPSVPIERTPQNQQARKEELPTFIPYYTKNSETLDFPWMLD